MKKPPDVIYISKPDNYEIRIKNMVQLLKYAFEKQDHYLHTRALIGYLIILQEQIKSI